MSERSAAVRLLLRSQSFLGGLSGVTQGVQAFGQKAQTVLNKSFSAGVEGAKGSLAKMGSGLKGQLSQYGAIGAGLITGKGLHDAIQMNSVYKDLAFSLEVASGKAVAWTAVQKHVEGSAKSTKRSQAELAEAFKFIAQTSGDADFAAATVEQVGHAMNNTGLRAEKLGTIVGFMGKNFGLSAQEVPQAMAAIVERVKQGKMDLDNLTDFSEMGSHARQAGLTGADGFRKILGMVDAVIPKVKDFGEVLTGTDIVLERMRDPAVLQGAFKAAGVKIDTKKFLEIPDAIGRMRHLLQKGGKALDETLRLEFPGREEMAAYDALTGDFRRAYQENYDLTSDSKKATQAGLEAFDRSISAFGKTTLTASRMAEESAKRQESPAAHLRESMNLLVEGLSQPEVLDSLNELAKQLPKMAKSVADLIGWATKHPLAAGAAVVGGKVALGFAGGALNSAGGQIGNLAATRFQAGVAAAGGPWKTAGKAIGIAAAAFIAYEVGKRIIDKATEKDLEQEKAGSRIQARADIATGSRVSKKEKEEALATAKAELARMQEGGIGKTIARGVGDIGLGLGMVTGAVSAEEAKDFRSANENKAARLRRSIADLESQLSGETAQQRRAVLTGQPESSGGQQPTAIKTTPDDGRKATGKLSGSIEDAGREALKLAAAQKRSAEAAERTARALERAATATGGSNGLAPKPSTTPGSAPRG